ncbi:MAG: 1,4-dihydroxy-2-naphthoate polyprenyltransferase [Flavobacteriales bacterium]|nr:1,4-dihydroxy-2-naphthoate polyprenyltransferase [Flavobacteriales bacterium]
MADLKHWLHALRMRTLPLAVSSIIVGSALAFDLDHRTGPGQFSGFVFALALLTAILLQILSNLANDLGDHQHGTDNGERVGPQRAVQSGAISPTQMKRAMLICGALAFACGIALIVTALGFSATMLVFLLLGLVAIGAAVKYTFGKDPYGYAGLGDVSVFLFFGIVGVCGTFYLHAHGIEPLILLPAIAFGCFSTGVLNVNNLRDIKNDKASGKITMAVRLGFDNAKGYHGILIATGLLCLIAYTAITFRAMPQWGWLITLPALGTHLRSVLRAHDPASLDPQLKKLALTTFFTALAFGAGLILVA